MIYSVVAPVFNEARNIQPLIAAVEAALRPLGRPFEFIIVDDGSTDGSDRILEEMARRHSFLRVIVFYRNQGQSAAFDAGIQNARGKIIITLDADLQNDPADIPSLLETLEEGGYDVVTGWRRNRQDGLWLRKIPSQAANWLIRKVTGTKVHDLGCSLRVYRAELLRELRLYGEMHRYICPLLEIMGARIGEQVVQHHPRLEGKSKYGLGRLFKVPLDLIYVWFTKNFGTKPMYLFGGAGAALFALAASFALAGSFAIGAAFALTSVVLFALGLIAELLMRTHFAARGTSSYLIRARFPSHEQAASAKAQKRAPVVPAALTARELIR